MIVKLGFLAGLLFPTAATSTTMTDAPAPPSNEAVRDRLIEIQRHQPDLSWILKEPPAYARQPKTSAETAGADRLAALAKAARRAGLDKPPRIVAELLAAQTLVLAEAQRQAIEAQIRITDDEIMARIREMPDLYDEYRMSHIFVAFGELPDHTMRSDAEAVRRAQAIRERILKGESFETLAVAESDDKSTASEGGMLSSMFGTYMDDAFFPAVRVLAEGAISEPVRGARGYHLIRLEQRTKSDSKRTRFLAEEALRSERFARAVQATIDAATADLNEPGVDAAR